MQKKRDGLFYAEDGAIALEACIALTLFMIVMMSLYSMIAMFTAQSVISHALQQAGQSVALENYKNNELSVKTLQAIPLYILQKVTDGIGASSAEEFDAAGGNFTDTVKAESTTVAVIAKKRFTSYLGGNEKNADVLLKSMGVKEGVNGINFTQCTVSGDDVVLKVTYKIRLAFYIEMFHFGEFESTQTVCCRLWK